MTTGYEPTAKDLAASICPQVASLISMVGSYIVIREVLIDHNERRGKAIPRILFALCIADLVFSLGWILATWPSPKDTPDLWHNIGNQATCNFQAFLLNFGLLASPLFNISLAFFCLLIVRYKWTDDKLRTIEPWVHGGIWAFSLAGSIFPIFLGIYNNAWTVCWFNSSPMGCKDSFRYGDEATCTRGDNAWIYAVAFTVFPVVICVFLSFVIMGMLYFFVRRTEQQTSKYATPSKFFNKVPIAKAKPSVVSFAKTTATPQSIESESSPSSVSREKRFILHRDSTLSTLSERGGTYTPKSNVVARKCFFYILSFVVVYALHCYVTLVFFISGKFWYSLHLSMYILLSLQGFCNTLVFVTGRKMKTCEGRFFKKLVCIEWGSPFGRRKEWRRRARRRRMARRRRIKEKGQKDKAEPAVEDHTTATDDHHTTATFEHHTTATFEHHSTATFEHHSAATDDHHTMATDDHRTTAADDHHTTAADDHQTMDVVEKST